MAERKMRMMDMPKRRRARRGMGQGIEAGEQVQAKMKREAGRRMLPSRAGGSRSSGGMGMVRGLRPLAACVAR